MSEYEKLEEYLEGLCICDDISRNEMYAILNNYEKWDKNDIDEKYYYYDGMKYMHSPEHSLDNFALVCGEVSKVIDPDIKVKIESDTKIKISVKVNKGINATCILDVTGKKSKVKYKLHDADQIDTYDNFIDAVNGFWQCLKDLEDKKHLTELEAFFDSIFITKE